MLLIMLTGCEKQSASSISAAGFQKSWSIGKQYNFDFKQELGRGWVQEFNQSEYHFVVPNKISSTQKEIALKLKNYPDAITFFFIDEVLITAETTANSTERILVPLSTAQRKPGRHQLNLMQFQQDDSGLSITMNHLIEYWVE
ncbi:hypothetical protein [Lapidilactobacillus wuchangensis]|uniref:hypothetical protein n=1 Tax=Lapidilactobacillus wuchangensis TaxID=2486001 RepID=UPI000F79D4FA|nr:hypothetical protein [Lapidilactobacillus wuchangensis]